MLQPKIFVSAVSEELGTARKKVCELLPGLGFQPVSMTNWGTAEGELKKWLRDEIDGCEGIIQLVGRSFGAEPPQKDPDFGRVSYTQFELLYALKKKKKVWIFVTTKDYLPDQPLAQLDLPKPNSGLDPQHFQSERWRLQQGYIEKLRELNLLRHPLADESKLAELILGLHTELAALRKGALRIQRMLAIALPLIAIGVVTTVILQQRSSRELQRKITKSAETVGAEVNATGETITQHQTKESDRVVSTLSKQIASIHDGPSFVLHVSPTATVHDPVGLKVLGTAPLPLAKLGAGAVVLSAPDCEARWIELGSLAEGDATYQLAAAKVPATEPFENTLLHTRLVWIAPGRFTMGASADELGSNSAERPTTAVHLTQGFWMAATETTNRQAALFLPRFGALAKSAPNHPATGMTWDEAAEYCRQLTQFESAARRLPEGWHYALPTEAEWEYACRAGTKTAFFSGEDETTVYDFAWTRDNSNGVLHPVGTRKPNTWGFYDMHGNATEWCNDWFGAYLPSSSADPQGPARGFQRCARGGNFASLTIKSCRSASRDRLSPNESSALFGFRVVLHPSLHTSPELP